MGFAIFRLYPPTTLNTSNEKGQCISRQETNRINIQKNIVSLQLDKDVYGNNIKRCNLGT